MMSWSPDGRGKTEPGPREVAWESSVRSGRDSNVVVDVVEPWGLGFWCFAGGGWVSLSVFAPAPSVVVGASGVEPISGGSGGSSTSMSGRFSGSYSGSRTGGSLPTSLIVPISHLGRSGIIERKES
jgi:hypothetical protein